MIIIEKNSFYGDLYYVLNKHNFFLMLFYTFMTRFTYFFSSYISKEILTIREAVWLTDNTYKYEDLVRMMGEVVSVLEGKIRVSTTNPSLTFFKFSLNSHWNIICWIQSKCKECVFIHICLEPHTARLWGGSPFSAASGETDHSPVQLHLWAVAALLCSCHATTCQISLCCTTAYTSTTSLW